MANFTEDFTKLRQASDQGRTNRHQFYAKMRDEVKQLAKETRDAAKKTRDDMGRVHAELEGMGVQLRSELAGFAGDLRGGGKIFLGG
ncbi:MAG: hypothetical protein H8E44_33570 [Planctomycetes bacterium]|nr:hypothetical protein [Planctomycetota bacterium]